MQVRWDDSCRSVLINRDVKKSGNHSLPTSSLDSEIEVRCCGFVIFSPEVQMGKEKYPSGPSFECGSEFSFVYHVSTCSTKGQKRPFYNLPGSLIVLNTRWGDVTPSHLVTGWKLTSQQLPRVSSTVYMYGGRECNFELSLWNMIFYLIYPRYRGIILDFSETLCYFCSKQHNSCPFNVVLTFFNYFFTGVVLLSLQP